MQYYEIIDGNAKLTNEGKQALDILGITLDELLSYPDKKLAPDYWQGCKTFVDQALKNQKGITWLDSCRVPYESEEDVEKATPSNAGQPTTTQTYGWKDCTPIPSFPNPSGRFPANLICGSAIDINIEALIEAKNKLT